MEPTWSPGKSQKEGQEDQGEIKELGRAPPLAVFLLVLLAFLAAVPWAPFQCIRQTLSQTSWGQFQGLQEKARIQEKRALEELVCLKVSINHP